MSVYSVGRVGSKEYRGAGKLVRFKPSAGGRFGNYERVERVTAAVGLFFSEGSRLRCCDISRSYAVALDIVFAVFRADISCKHFQSALSSRVCGNGLSAKLAHHGTDIYNFSVSLFNHRRDYGLCDYKRTVEVYVDNLPELRRCHFAHRYALDYPRVVDENIDYAHFLFDLLYG